MPSNKLSLILTAIGGAAATQATGQIVFWTGSVSSNVSSAPIYFELGDNNDPIAALSLASSDGNLRWDTYDSPNRPKITGNYLQVVTSGYVSQLSGSTMIDATQSFADAKFPGSFFGSNDGLSGWGFGDRAYVGVRLEEGATETFRYGWLDVSRDGSSTFTVYGLALEQTIGVGIEAGAVPEPATTGLMAALAGSAAVFAARRRRKTA